MIISFAFELKFQVSKKFPKKNGIILLSQYVLKLNNTIWINHNSGTNVYNGNTFTSFYRFFSLFCPIYIFRTAVTNPLFLFTIFLKKEMLRALYVFTRVQLYNM